MSREIKFRCWDQKDKKYLLPEKQGFVILPTMPSFGVTIPYENCSNPGNIDEDCIDWADADLLMGRYELEQYIGVDKNGKEMYEGDIVKARYYEKYGSKKWYNVCGRIHMEPYATYIDDNPDGEWESWIALCRDFEVVGNVHENKEQL